MSKIYKNLISAERVKDHTVKHQVLMHYGCEETYRYKSIRLGMVFATMGTPSFFVVAGMEADDLLSPTLRATLRVIEEEEVEGLSLDELFNSVTDSYSSMLCDAIYLDFKSNEEHRLKLWDYLDKHQLRGVNLIDVPFKDMVLRFSMLRDYNDSGALVLDKSSALFSDIQGVSRSNLKDNPEKWYRLNALSFVVSGFEKYPPVKPLRVNGVDYSARYNGDGWML